MTNCKNCGAILTGGKCEYCGTEYETTTETFYSDSGIVFCDKDVEIVNDSFLTQNGKLNLLVRLQGFLTPNEIREALAIKKRKRGLRKSDV